MGPYSPDARCTAAVIGAGPAGLMAAEALSAGGVEVHVYDALPSAGRKFLMAGKGGLNLSHAEPLQTLLSRYGARRPPLEPMVRAFDADGIRAWAQSLGIDTFEGSSGRIFPREMKAAPLLRAWLHRLRAAGTRMHVRHRWVGWDERGGLRFATPEGERIVQAAATVLALGGASWPQLGSTGAWVPLLAGCGVEVTPLAPANCGFEVTWSAHFRERFAGTPVKSVVGWCDREDGSTVRTAGEFVISDVGIEGGLVYALAAPLRDAIAARGTAVLHLDLAPGRTRERLHAELAHPRGSRSLSSHVQSRLGLRGVKWALVRETLAPDAFSDAAALARAIKSLPLRLERTRPLAEAISTAGGVAFEALDGQLMIRRLPGMFCAGEMLDWEAPTGGYLLTACLATGRAAGEGALRWLNTSRRPG